MEPVKIILAEDHALLRQGIKKIIQGVPGLQVILEAEDGLELMREFETPTPDIVILDISMPRLRGLEAAELIKRLYPKVKVLILSMNLNKDLFYKAMKIGVNGYVLKEDLTRDMHAAIKTALEGKTFVSPLLFRQVPDESPPVVS